MNELIPITEHNGKKAVSARLLHEFLGSKREFATWIKDRIKKYGLIENQDYISFDEIVKRENGASVKTEYVLSLSAAKELSMVEGNAKGKQARQYFIACEEKLIESVKPLSQVEIVAQSAQILLEQDRRLNSVEKKVEMLEAKTATRSDYFAVVGYATLNKISIGLKLAASIGKRASALCEKRGIATETIPDPRFGTVKTYPYHILDEVFNQPIR